MILEYMVGLHVGNKHETVTVEAEDALIAALNVKHDHLCAQAKQARRFSTPHHDIEEESGRVKCSPSALVEQFG
jgi:hypothetical protein